MILIDINLLACGSEKDINIYDIKNDKLVKKLMGHTALLRDLYYMIDSNILVSSSDDKSIKLWDINKGILLQTFVGHTHSANRTIQFSKDVILSHIA
jgi:WD40 repeat protein